MPTYEYLCAKCGHSFDLFQSITANPITICPKEHCAQKRWGRGSVRKQIHAGAGLLFKGSGFYITDYRSEGYKAAAKQDAAGAGDGKSTAGASETKAEAKPESKTDKTDKGAKSDKPAKAAPKAKTKS